MEEKLSARAESARVRSAALIAALACVWRLPHALGLDAQSMAGQAVGVALAAGLYLLLKRAFLCRDRRLNAAAYGLGAVFACLTVMGGALRRTGELDLLHWTGALVALATAVPLALAYGAVLLLGLRWAEYQAARPAGNGALPLWKRLCGNGYVIFALLLACWTPVWLAFWPGFFNADNATQFYSYMDGMHSTHHPLLHTLLLGGLMALGMERSAEGSAAVGLALYCVVQMVLLAAMLAYACVWLKRRGAPFWARLAVTLLLALFPFYALWPMCGHKDVLFSALVLMTALQLCDLWREGADALRSPLRMAAFVLTAALMMLLRNNGLYALALAAPFVVYMARGRRLRVLALLAGCAAVYLAGNAALVRMTEAEPGSTVEMLSIPLQQMGRALREQPDALDEADRELITALYGEGDMGQIYDETLADALKWAIDYDALEENLPELLGLWARLGLRAPTAYVEAFMVQNLPFLLPGAERRFDLDVGVTQMELYPIEEHSFLPWLRAPYEAYNDTLSFLGLPGVRLLSDPAFMAWLAAAGLVLALRLRRRGAAAGLILALAVWATCLLGPVAAIRYVLSVYYVVPVMGAALLAPGAKAYPAKK